MSHSHPTTGVRHSLTSKKRRSRDTLISSGLPLESARKRKPLNKKENEETSSESAEPNDDGFLVVGLGASAGGIQALQEFFRQVDAATGMAFVVILHLSPAHDSKLAQIV